MVISFTKLTRVHFAELKRDGIVLTAGDEGLERQYVLLSSQMMSNGCVEIVVWKLCVPVCICMFVCLFGWFVCLFVCLFVWLVGWFVGWLVCLFVCLFVCVFVCLFRCMFRCVFLCPGPCGSFSDKNLSFLDLESAKDVIQQHDRQVDEGVCEVQLGCRRS